MATANAISAREALPALSFVWQIGFLGSSVVEPYKKGERGKFLHMLCRLDC
jgi:hypothetical protein